MRPDEPISRIMTEAVVAIEVDRPVSEVLDCFLQYPIHHLPVVQLGKLVGMLSSADVMKLEFFVPKSAWTVRRTSTSSSPSRS
jgi:signal-transduction protein with cAMP-binding, CBS, and nucleotidyltransferase domain